MNYWTRRQPYTSKQVHLDQTHVSSRLFAALIATLYEKKKKDKNDDMPKKEKKRPKRDEKK